VTRSSAMSKVSESKATTPPKRTPTSSTRRSAVPSASIGRQPSSIPNRRFGIALDAAHEDGFQRVVGLEADAGAEDDGLEGRVDQLHGDVGLERDAIVEAVQQTAATDEVDAPVHE